MTTYLIATTIVFTFLLVIWSRKSWLDFTLKMVFAAMTGWSGFLLAQAFGYIVKV